MSNPSRVANEPTSANLRSSMMLSKSRTSAAHWSCISPNQARIAAGLSRGSRGRRERPPHLIRPAHRIVGGGGAVEHEEAAPAPVGGDAAAGAVLPFAGGVAVLRRAKGDHLDLHDGPAQSRTSTLVPTSRNLTSMVASALKPNPRAPGSTVVPVLCALAIIGGGSRLACRQHGG